MNIITRFEDGIMSVHASADGMASQYIERPIHRAKLLILDAEGVIEKVIHWGQNVEGGFKVEEDDSTADAEVSGATEKLTALKSDIEAKREEVAGDGRVGETAGLDSDSGRDAGKHEADPAGISSGDEPVHSGHDEAEAPAADHAELDNYDVTPTDTSAAKTVDDSGDTAGHEHLTGFAALARKEEEIAASSDDVTTDGDHAVH